MKTLLIVLTLVEVAILVVVLALYLIVIAAKLRKISHTLGLVTFGVRAIEKQTEPIGPSRRTSTRRSSRWRGRWNRSSARRTPSRRDRLGRRRREARRELTMATAPPGTVERRRLRITGVVQGVGFRPFVHGLAARHRLGGFVLNDGRGVVVEAEGLPKRWPPSPPRSSRRLRRSPGSTSSKSSRSTRATSEVLGSSEAGAVGAAALVPPDVATCEDCLRELFDPADRRHRYPFINCTQCGPRFTIVERGSLRPREHDHGRLRDVRSVPRRVRGSGRPPLPCRADRVPRLRTAAASKRRLIEWTLRLARRRSPPRSS